MFSSQLNEKLDGEHQEEKNGRKRDLPKGAQHENVLEAKKKRSEKKGNEFNVYVNARDIVPHAFWTARIEMIHPDAALKRFLDWLGACEPFFPFWRFALLRVPA